MTNEKYKQGYALENKLVNYLKDCGWFATRSAGSHSCADVIGITPNGVTYLFQCKSTLKLQADLTSIFNSDRVQELTKMSFHVQKYICIKQKLSSDLVYYKWDHEFNKWKPIIF